ncbi:MAG: hypothetical protein AB1486_18065 [Planctomycetota bacterium]
MTAYGMTGTIGYYRGPVGVKKLLADLAVARREKLKLIVTMGDVNPSLYADARGEIDMARVREELAPFVEIADQIKPFVVDGTIWGIRFMDEPHDPRGLPRGVTINAQRLGDVMALLKEVFGKVRVGSTSPARYMVNVPNADWCSGQYCHDTARRRALDPVTSISEDAALAARKGMSYVASLNACSNSVDNRTFFEVYLALAKLPDVDFMTSWQWPQGHHPQPSFERRLNDPGVQDLVRSIPQACRRTTPPPATRSD